MGNRSGGDGEGDRVRPSGSPDAALEEGQKERGKKKNKQSLGRFLGVFFNTFFERLEEVKRRQVLGEIAHATSAVLPPCQT